MLWEDVIIGEGRKGNSAILCFDIEGEHGISHNKGSYWISDCFMGLGMTIFKDTPEGQILSNLIAEKVGLEKIQHFLDETIIKNIEPSKLMAAVERKLDDAFHAGELFKMQEIRSSLGLR